MDVFVGFRYVFVCKSFVRYYISFVSVCVYGESWISFRNKVVDS